MWFALTQPPYGTPMPKSGRRPQHHSRHFTRRASCPVYPQERPKKSGTVTAASGRSLRACFWSRTGGEAEVVRAPQNGVNDPNVWSGRALQENFVELAASGLASMYPASHDGISVKS